MTRKRQDLREFPQDRRPRVTLPGVKVLRPLALSAVLLAATAGPGGATVRTGGATERDIAPPGNSAVEQTRESAPLSSSNRREATPAQNEALEREGRDGVALAEALDRIGGVPADAARPAPTGPRRGPATDQAADESLVGAAASSTVGPLPAWALLIGTAVAIASRLVLRRRRAS